MTRPTPTKSGLVEALHRDTPDGWTARELNEALGWGHGSVSGVLSRLHAQGRILRTSGTRKGQRIYIHPRWRGPWVDLAGVVTEPQGRAANPTDQTLAAALEDLARLRNEVGRILREYGLGSSRFDVLRRLDRDLRVAVYGPTDDDYLTDQTLPEEQP